MAKEAKTKSFNISLVPGYMIGGMDISTNDGVSFNESLSMWHAGLRPEMSFFKDKWIFGFGVTVGYAGTNKTANIGQKFTEDQRLEIIARMQFNNNKSSTATVVNQPVVDQYKSLIKDVSVKAKGGLTVAPMVHVGYAFNPKFSAKLYAGAMFSQTKLTFKGFNGKTEDVNQNLWRPVVGLEGAYKVSPRFSVGLNVGYTFASKKKAEHNDELQKLQVKKGVLKDELQKLEVKQKGGFTAGLSLTLTN
jgi:long-subunit fatty acid transport protein